MMKRSAQDLTLYWSLAMQQNLSYRRLEKLVILACKNSKTFELCALHLVHLISKMDSSIDSIYSGTSLQRPPSEGIFWPSKEVAIMGRFSIKGFE